MVKGKALVPMSKPPGDHRSLRVLVTGAGSGVGEATARLFSHRGATLALVGRRRKELERVRGGLPGPAHVFDADVSDPGSAREAVAGAVATMGGLDIVVNAAGIATYAGLADLSDEMWGATIGINLSGTFYISRAAAIHMVDHGGGAIVNVASDLAVMGVAGLVHYSSSKAGVLGLTRGLAAELAPTVRVNAVSPGPIDTPMLRAGVDAAEDPTQALIDKERSVPLRRLATPEEVAEAIHFLAVHATFATGASMSLDGGTSAQ